MIQSLGQWESDSKTMLKDSFLHLVRLGIGNETPLSFSSIGSNEPIDWDAIQDLAARQGLSAIIVDGVEKLPEKQRPPKPILLQWIGEVLQGYEFRYELYRRAIAELAGFYNSHGLKMMVLKGYVCSLDWPKPEHRPTGDIDIWQFGKQEDADQLLAKDRGVEIDKSHHHHTVFYWRDFMVENHYDFINVHHNKSNPELERIFKELGEDDSHFINIYGERVYIPSPNLHALFLIRHAINHFASSEITIRQLMDWGFYVKANGRDVDWDWLEGVLVRFGMKPLYGLFNAICVEDLGFESEHFNWVQFEPRMKDRVLNEIISPAYSNDLPQRFIPRVFYKYHRWKANGWKRELSSNESGISTFWAGVRAHLIKPSSI